MVGGADYCLSPILGVGQRPVPLLASATNTTITVMWEEQPLPSVCEGVVVSRLPLTYSIAVEIVGGNEAPIVMVS